MTDGWRDHKRRDQLRFLFKKQDGRCHICKQPCVLDGGGGDIANARSAVRFRLGSTYGRKGRVRPRVMACRKCAQERSDQITASIPVEELWTRSKRWPTEFYSIPGAQNEETAHASQAAAGEHENPKQGQIQGEPQI